MFAQSAVGLPGSGSSRFTRRGLWRTTFWRSRARYACVVVIPGQNGRQNVLASFRADTLDGAPAFGSKPLPDPNADGFRSRGVPSAQGKTAFDTAARLFGDRDVHARGASKSNA